MDDFALLRARAALLRIKLASAASSVASKAAKPGFLHGLLTRSPWSVGDDAAEQVLRTRGAAIPAARKAAVNEALGKLPNDPHGQAARAFYNKNPALGVSPRDPAVGKHVVDIRGADELAKSRATRDMFGQATSAKRWATAGHAGKQTLAGGGALGALGGAGYGTYEGGKWALGDEPGAPSPDTTTSPANQADGPSGPGPTTAAPTMSDMKPLLLAGGTIAGLYGLHHLARRRRNDKTAGAFDWLHSFLYKLGWGRKPPGAVAQQAPAPDQDAVAPPVPASVVQPPPKPVITPKLGANMMDQSQPTQKKPTRTGRIRDSLRANISAPLGNLTGKTVGTFHNRYYAGGPK